MHGSTRREGAWLDCAPVRGDTARVLLLAAMLAAGCDAPIPRRGDAALPPDGGAPIVEDAGGLDAGSAPLDAGALDAGAADAGPPPTPDAGPLGPPLYPEGARHSPLPLDLADGLRAIAGDHPGAREDVFAKVGDSITDTPTFLGCFVDGPVDLGGRDALGATIAYFRAGDAAGRDPFRRDSVAATSGWTAARAIAGSPSPLAQEVAALRPRFASVMFGTNDVGFVDLDTYGRNMTTIVDTLLAAGTIPLLSTIPPRDDDAGTDARVPVWNGFLRALAQSRRVPLVDLHMELMPLAAHGLYPDGVHPAPSRLGPCVLTAAGLEKGANVRNLLVLEGLDRLRRAVVLGEDALDASAPRLVGAGTNADPFVVPSLPFAGHADTRREGEAVVARWDACSTANEGGPEVRFRFRVARASRIVAAVSSGAGADIDVHVVRAGAAGAGCLARDNRQVELDLTAGDYDLVADTYVGSAGPLPGELFVALFAR